MGVSNDVRVTFRVDKDLKEKADYLFERLGLNMSVAFNIFLRKAVNEEAIPFPVSLNRSGFGHGLSAEYITHTFNSAVQDKIKTNQQMLYKTMPNLRKD